MLVGHPIKLNDKRMKHLFYSILVAVVLALVGCQAQDAPRETMTNGVELTIPGNAILAEDDTSSVFVHAMMAFAPSERASVKLAFTGNEDAVLQVESDEIVFEPGQKEVVLRVKSNGKHSLSISKTVTLQVTSASHPQIKGFGKGVQITVNPDADIPILTETQLQLIAGVKKKYGIDLARLLGKLPVETTVVFNQDDKENFFQGQSQRVYKGYSVITLGDDATVDHPTLKMLTNPMGLTTFLYDVLKRKTVNDNEFFMRTPYGKAAVKAINYQESKETFSVALSNIGINPANNSITFTGEKENAYGDMIMGIPFTYDYSAWNRLLKEKEKGTVVEIEEDGRLVGYTINDDFLTMGGSLDPNRFLGVSNISSDTFGNNPSDWVALSALLDLEKGTLSFTFPWDYADGNGYEQVHVVYTLHR